MELKRHPSNSRQKLPLDIIRLLPKAELHCHLDGSVRIPTIIDLAKQQGVDLPTFDEDELRKLVCAPLDCPSLEEYLRGFDITLKVMQKRYAITRCVYELCEDAVADGVRYVEIRFSPILHTKEGLSLSSVMEAVCEGLMMAELNMPITVRIIVCGMRQLDSTVTKNLAEIAWRYKNRGVVGFDLAGPENGFSSKTHKDAFDLVKQKLLNCTLHSGEAASWASVRDSIRYCGAQRIGHGVRIRENAPLLQYITNQRIPIEICVTSNMQTKAINSLGDHPLRHYFDYGVVVVPCTDNVTVSNTTLSDEYYLIQQQYDFSIPELVKLIDYGFRSAFLDFPLRRRLRAEAANSIITILAQNGYDISGLEVLKELNFVNYMPLTPRSAVDRSKRNSLDGASNFAAEVRRITNQNQDTSYQRHYARAEQTYISHLQQFKRRSLDASSVTSVETTSPAASKSLVTLELIQSLPKTDLDCRFNGSVSIETLWRLYTEAKADQTSSEWMHFNDTLQRYQINDIPETIDQFREMIQIEVHERNSVNRSQQLMTALLQTKHQIELGIDDIYKCAEADNVAYFELQVCPHMHTKLGLSATELMEIILHQRQLLENKYDIKSGIVLYVDNKSDSVSVTLETAKLALRYRYYDYFLKQQHHISSDGSLNAATNGNDAHKHEPRKHILAGLRVRSSVNLTSIESATTNGQLNVDVETKLRINDSDAFEDAATVNVDHNSNDYLKEIINILPEVEESVCGFAMHGAELTAEQMGQYSEVFNLLKDKEFNVSIVAGRSDPHSVVRAITEGGANRISGAFQIDKDPDIMMAIANREIPIEISMTDLMKASTEDVRLFADSAVRLYIDNNVRVTQCSFDLTLYPYSRSELLLNLVRDSQMTIVELLTLLATGFRRSFQHHAVNKRQQSSFWSKASKILASRGCKYYREMPFFLPK